MPEYHNIFRALKTFVGVITYSGTLYNSVPYFSSHAHFSTAIDAWSLANSINPEHLSEDEMKS